MEQVEEKKRAQTITIPKNVSNMFKAACAEEGKKISEVLAELMVIYTRDNKK